MGTIHQLHPISPRYTSGTVHVWRREEGGYEIGHESSPGNSWGYFDTFDCPVRAMIAACRLNIEKLDGKAEMVFADDVIGDLEVGHDRREAHHG